MSYSTYSPVQGFSFPSLSYGEPPNAARRRSRSNVNQTYPLESIARLLNLSIYGDSPYISPPPRSLTVYSVTFPLQGFRRPILPTFSSVNQTKPFESTATSFGPLFEVGTPYSIRIQVSSVFHWFVPESKTLRVALGLTFAILFSECSANQTF